MLKQIPPGHWALVSQSVERRVAVDPEAIAVRALQKYQRYLMLREQEFTRQMARAYL